MRQVGVGSQGAAEPFSIFHQLIFDEWTAGSLEAHSKREAQWMKQTVSEWSCGMQNSASGLLPEHAAVAGWTHSAISFVEQEGVGPMPNCRVNHIFRVHVHMIVEEGSAAKAFDLVELGLLERPLPGFTDDSQEQVTVRAGLRRRVQKVS